MHDNQKQELLQRYSGFAQGAKLTPEQTDKLGDLLADSVIENMGHVTTVLCDKSTPEQMNQIFASEDAVLLEKVQALLGPDGLAQYQEYTRNLFGSVTAEHFKGRLTGTDTERSKSPTAFSGNCRRRPRRPFPTPACRRTTKCFPCSISAPRLRTGGRT